MKFLLCRQSGGMMIPYYSARIKKNIDYLMNKQKNKALFGDLRRKK